MPSWNTAGCSTRASGHEPGQRYQESAMGEPLKNDLLLRALLREPTPRRPIWLMRQAGRYLPEYRATRERAGGFLEMCTNPEIACEISRSPDIPWTRQFCFRTFSPYRMR